MGGRGSELGGLPGLLEGSRKGGPIERRPGGTDSVPVLQADRSGFRTIAGDHLYRGKRSPKMGYLETVANTGFPERPKMGKVPFLHEYATGRA